MKKITFLKQKNLNVLTRKCCKFYGRSLTMSLGRCSCYSVQIFSQRQQKSADRSDRDINNLPTIHAGIRHCTLLAHKRLDLQQCIDKCCLLALLECLKLFKNRLGEKCSATASIVYSMRRLNGRVVVQKLVAVQ